MSNFTFNVCLMCGLAVYDQIDRQQTDQTDRQAHFGRPPTRRRRRKKRRFPPAPVEPVQIVRQQVHGTAGLASP